MTRWDGGDQRALVAIATQFFVNGALFASFIPRLPEIRDQVGIGVAGVGIIMSIAGVVALGGSVVVGPTIARFGTRRVMLASGTLVSLSLPVIGWANKPLVLLIGLASMMTFDVLVDVAMNLQGSWLSARRHAPVMNRLHGLWSLGTLVGGVSSAWIAAAGVPLDVHLTAAAAILLAVLAAVGPGLLRVDEHPRDEARRPGDDHAEAVGTADRATPVLVLFGMAGFFAVVIESTSIEWAAFRFTDDFAAGAGVAALGFVAVTLGMTVGRFLGDGAGVRLGADPLNSLAVGVTGVGLLLGSFADRRVISMVGFLLVGMGISTMLPTLYDRAAQRDGLPGAGLGALVAGQRVAGLAAPFAVGVLAATSLAVGSAIAIVTLPSLVGYLVVSRTIRPHGPGRAAADRT